MGLDEQTKISPALAARPRQALTVFVADLELQKQRIADLSTAYVLPVSISDSHRDVGRSNNLGVNV